jgi:hypothetical protein
MISGGMAGTFLWLNPGMDGAFRKSRQCTILSFWCLAIRTQQSDWIFGQSLRGEDEVVSLFPNPPIFGAGDGLK